MIEYPRGLSGRIVGIPASERMESIFPQREEIIQLVEYAVEAQDPEMKMRLAWRSIRQKHNTEHRERERKARRTFVRKARGREKADRAEASCRSMPYRAEGRSPNLSRFGRRAHMLRQHCCPNLEGVQERAAGAGVNIRGSSTTQMCAKDPRYN